MYNGVSDTSDYTLITGLGFLIIFLSSGKHLFDKSMN